MVSSKPKIAVLGAGLLGRMLTVSVMNHFDVTVFDKDDGDAKQSAGYLAAAMLAPLAESTDCSADIMQFGKQALALWPEFLAKLDSPVYFQQAGSLIVAFEQDAAALEQFQSRLKGEGFQTVNASKICQLEPELMQRFKKGLYLPDEGQLDNRQLLQAMALQMRKHDVAWHTHSTVEVTQDAVTVNGKVLKGFDWIIDCRGMGLQTDETNKFGLRGVRGEVVRVHAPDVTLNRPVRLMHPRYPIYIAPKENHHFVIGATQVESEDSRKPTVRSALELLSACFSVHSGFAEAEIISMDAGLRPAYLDNHPKIVQTGNRIVVNGLFRHGYLLAPVVIEACMSLIHSQNSASQTKSNHSLLDLLPGLVGSENTNT